MITRTFTLRYITLHYATLQKIRLPKNLAVVFGNDVIWEEVQEVHYK